MASSQWGPDRHHHHHQNDCDGGYDEEDDNGDDNNYYNDDNDDHDMTTMTMTMMLMKYPNPPMKEVVGEEGEPSCPSRAVSGFISGGYTTS